MRTWPPTVVAAAAGLLTLFAWAPTAEAIVVASGQDRFPVPGSIYRSQNGTTFPLYDAVSVGILSMDLTGTGGLVGPSDSVALPSPGETFQVDSFFDVFTELSVGGDNYSVDSFFDITYDINAGGASSAGSWDTEMVSMLLSGDAGGYSVVIRESPTLRSTGTHSVTDLGNGEFQVDSFFDVFTELSIDGGGTFAPASSSIRLRLTGIVPEPSSVILSLIGMSGLGMITRRRRV